MAIPSSVIKGLDTNYYQGIDFSVMPETAVIKVLVTMNRSTDGFKQSNGRSIIGNLMFAKDLYRAEIDMESGAFKSRGFDPAQLSRLSAANTAGCPMKLVAFTAEESSEGVGMAVNFTDNDGDELEDILDRGASKFGSRAVILEVECNPLVTVQVLSPNGIDSPTIIPVNWRVVGVYHPPQSSILVYGADTFKVARVNSVTARDMGITRSTSMGLTGALSQRTAGMSTMVAAAAAAKPANKVPSAFVQRSLAPTVIPEVKAAPASSTEAAIAPDAGGDRLPAAPADLPAV